jgi:hypothetical protein
MICTESLRIFESTDANFCCYSRIKASHNGIFALCKEIRQSNVRIQQRDDQMSNTHLLIFQIPIYYTIWSSSEKPMAM